MGWLKTTHWSKTDPWLSEPEPDPPGSGGTFGGDDGNTFGTKDEPFGGTE